MKIDEKRFDEKADGDAGTVVESARIMPMIFDADPILKSWISENASWTIDWVASVLKGSRIKHISRFVHF